MMEDTPEKLQYLKSFSRWIDYGCRPAPGLFGSFKSDCGVFITAITTRLMLSAVWTEQQI